MSQIIAFSKRFTSPVIGWPFPVKSEISPSSPGRVGGVRAWTRLQMTDNQAMALLRYAGKVVKYCSISLLNNGESIRGREAWDMVAAKGFYTPNPGIPDDSSDIPIVTVEDIIIFLRKKKECMEREDIEMAYDLDLCITKDTNVRSHEISIVSFDGQEYILNIKNDNKNTEKAVRYLWRTYEGRAKFLDRIWPKDQMDIPLGEGDNIARSLRSNESFRVVPCQFPGVIVLEVFDPLGRYLWFETDHSFNVLGSGWTTNDVYIYQNKTISGGIYSDNLPGEECPQGWMFAKELHDRLEEEWLDFKVSRPWRWSNGYLSIDIKINRNDKLDLRIKNRLGFIRGEIPERMWDQETIQKILNIVAE